MEHETLDWWKGDAETTLRVDYPLTPESLFIDVGGHTGDWTKTITERYDCRAYLFEPVPEFMCEAAVKLIGNPKILLCPFALSDYDGTTRISVNGIHSSFYKSAEKEVEVKVQDAGRYLKGVEAALLSLNCEGSEFKILPRLIETGLIGNFEHIQVQFHELYPDAEKRRQEIRERLRETHEESYSYKWVWESWARK